MWEWRKGWNGSGGAKGSTLELQWERLLSFRLSVSRMGVLSLLSVADEQRIDRLPMNVSRRAIVLGAMVGLAMSGLEWGRVEAGRLIG